ncbi:MAG: Hint domain-containing protein, partial [Alphaproteobacteria bacterium]|nr:Hint domain-containing protein [Alphaproteobacteria bacterium]
MASGFQLLYSALDGSGTVQLWTTDGTVSGTVELTHVANDWGGLYAEDITGYAPGSGIVGAAFRGIDAAGNPSLWVTDGTVAGTAELHAAGAAAAGLDPKALIALGRLILFTGTDTEGRSAIWASDGTDVGTVELGAIAGVGPVVADPQSLISDGRAFFVAGGQLMVSDGTAAGTTQLAGGLDTADGGPSIATVPGGVLFAAGGRLWTSDGTAAGTRALGGQHAPMLPQDLVSFGSGVLFRGTDAVGNTQLWFTDGTVTGTQALTAFTASAAASWPSDITALPDRAVFFAADTGGIMQLWSTDGTAAGTMMLSAVQDPAGLGLTAGMIATVGGHALFTSLLGGVWGTDGTVAGTFSVNGSVVYPSAAVADDGLVVATGGATGTLVKIDGASGGSHVLASAPYATGLAVLNGGVPMANGGALPCFLPGTRLLTYRGEIAMEALELGDLLWTGFGGWQALRWIGRGCAVIGDAEDHPARPVLIRAGALGEGVPRRDVRVTQGHCLLFPDSAGPGALVPAALLVNGVSILLEPGGGGVEYFHVGLARHDV